MQVTIQGTVKELASHGLRVNGKPVTQQMISVLVRLGACEEVGVEEKEPGQKGPPARVYRFDGKKTFNFSIDNKVSKQKPAEVEKPQEQKEEVKQEPKQEAANTPLEALKNAVEENKPARELVMGLPPLPEVLQNMTENDVKAMIVGLQGLAAMMGNNTAKH